MLAQSLSTKTKWYSFLKLRKMHKELVIGLLLCITFLAIVEDIGAVNCPPISKMPVNFNDENLTDKCFSIFICSYSGKS